MAKTNPKIEAQTRTVLGKKVKNLRAQGITPATVYGKGVEPVSVQINTKELDKLFEDVGESGLIDFAIDGKVVPVLFKNPQYHPVLGNLIHIDCHQVNLKEKITATVPIEFVGESTAVKLGNVLVEVLMEIEVEALPTDLPEKIEVDLTVLETVESVVTVADLKVDRTLVEVKNDPEQVIVKVELPREEEVEPVAAAEEATEPVVAPAMAQKTEEEKEADAKTKAAEKAAYKKDEK
ncbi:MAG: 50S ribosomal protein L25 [Candidatus Shapirobacteria bacterium]|jgi:large subunit ribosomal protein L25